MSLAEQEIVKNRPANDGFPEGWVETTLSQLLLSLESGSRPRGGVRGISDGIPSIGGEHLDDEGGFRIENVKYVPEAFFKRMSQGHIRAGDVLIVKDGATTGKVSYVDTTFPYPTAVVNEHVFICRPSSAVDGRYLFRFLHSEEGQRRILENFRGSAQGGINQSFAPNTAIPLPPFAEQRRIASKVEEVLSLNKSTRARLARVPTLLKRFRQAVLAAACSGRLTADWREANPDVEPAAKLLERILTERRVKWEAEGRKGKYQEPAVPDTGELPELPETWCWASCGSLCQPNRSLTYGVIKLGDPCPNGIPTLRSSDVRRLYIDESHVKKITPKIEANYQRTRLVGGELVVTVRGTLGGVAVVPERMAGYNVSREVAVVPIKSCISAAFFSCAIGSEGSQSWLTGVAKGIAYTGINIEDLKLLPLPVPPISEQQEIVWRVERLFRLAEAIEKRMAAAATRADRLTQAILAKAFRGELVPTEAELARAEGRDYEPAAVLLKQVNECQQAHTAKR